MVKLFDFGLEGILARLLHARSRINIRRHVDVVGSRAEAGFEHRVVRLAHTGIAGHGDLVLAHEGCQRIGVHGISLHHEKPTLRGFCRELVCKNGIHIRQNDSVETIVFVEFLADDRSHTANSNNHCVCHKKINLQQIVSCQ